MSTRAHASETGKEVIPTRRLYPHFPPARTRQGGDFDFDLDFDFDSIQSCGLQTIKTPWSGIFRSSIMYNRHLRLSYLLRLLRNCLHELHDLALAVADDYSNNLSAYNPFCPKSCKASPTATREYSPARPLLQSTVTGRWKAVSFCLNLRSASLEPVAPSTTLPAFEGPKYSKILLSWSGVGAPS